jgi:hypothetical protein
LLMRWWRAWCDQPPPPMVQLLLDELWEGHALDCYAH